MRAARTKPIANKGSQPGTTHPANDDLIAGLLFIALGLASGVYIHVTLDIGTPQTMGPGYIPSRLAGLLVLFGAVIALRARPSAREAPAIAWRGLIALTGSMAMFGLTAGPLGLIPALALAIFLAAWASRRMTMRLALILTASLTAACILIFKVMLGAHLRLLGPWLDF
jgi:putative tricarboxylic transport membrane protein